LYWLNVPAILKLWIDEVFRYGFAYGSQGDKLKDKNFMLSFTTGAEEAEYRVTGKHRLRIYEFCKGMENCAMYAQMNYKDPICFFGTVSNDDTDLKNKLKIHAQSLIKNLTESNMSSASRYAV
jgi:putative NADPH-quinone reductase